jgi:hypothetical protein
MAEDHLLAEIFHGGDEIPPNPQQVFFILLRRGDPGFEAAVDKEVIRGLVIEAQFLEKFPVLRGQNQLLQVIPILAPIVPQGA